MRGWTRTVCLVATLAAAPRLVVAWELALGAPPTAPECAPDEGLQYWTVMRYADGDVATWPASGSIYSAYPPAPYLWHAAALALGRRLPDACATERFPSSWPRLRHYATARLGGVLLGCLTVIFAILAAEAWSGSRRLAIASGVAVALYPQLVFVNGYVNADSFTIAAVAALAAALARWAAAGEGGAGLAWVGAAAGAVALGKPTGAAALPPTALWLLDAHRRGRLDARALGRAALAAAVVAGPTLALNGLRNGGDGLGLLKYRTLVATEYAAHPATAALPFLRELARSSFGVFGRADLPMPAAFYVGAACFLAVGVAAAGRAARSASTVAGASTPRARAAWWIAAALTLDLALVIWNGWTVDAQPQGRYLLPTLVPLWAAVTCALGGVSGRPVLLAGWLVFLATATTAALVLIHTHPCL
ncbi:MAG: glycosyltransferase family 39 protein [Deltaproteobacteria bacterium]|nr:glycosyltransferase family 39 protein [Deltaproteobacteria bacterium]